MKREDYYLIFGAQMVNKGAQAMLFVTVSEIRKRDPHANIIVFVYDKWKSEDDPSVYDMEFVPISMKYIMNLSSTLLSKVYILFKRAGIKNNSPDLNRIDDILRNAKMAFDISGYALSNQWGIGGSLFYLSKFSLLNKYGISTYVMPQSFGPFDYHSFIKNVIMQSYIKRYLKYPKYIFAREKEGFDCLNKLGLDNIHLSYDLVLQSKSINEKYIYKTAPAIKHIETVPVNSVAIIPNSSNYKYIDKQYMLSIYSSLVERLNIYGKNIFLIAHSSQDMENCKEIMDYCKGNFRISIVEEDLNCIEYGHFIQKFNYVIASRFHSIVNAYKEHVPCIAIGWATKYGDLLNALGQGQFNFDVREIREVSGLLLAIDNMERTYKLQIETIKDRLDPIQEQSCFAFLDDEI